MPDASPIRVLIADDQPVTLGGLERIIDREPELECVGLARDGEELVRMYRDVRPDVVVTDLSMPVLNGVLAAERIIADHPDAKICAVTSIEDRRVTSDAIAAGVLGFLVKDASAGEIATAIKSVAAGHAHFDRHATGVLVSNTRVGQDHGLTERQVDVLRLLAEGLSRAEIGERLHVAEATVKTHLSGVYMAFGLSGRTAPMQAVRRARELGILESGLT